MHKRMEILMARMESHPEEFDITFRHMQLNYDNRWDWIIKPLMDRCESIAKGEPSFIMGFLSDDEVIQVFYKLQSVQGSLCTEKIMNDLLKEERADRITPHKFGGGGIKFGGNRASDDSSDPNRNLGQ